jgi:ferredoxin
MLGTIILIVVGVILVTLIVLWLFGEQWHPLRRSTWLFMRQEGLRRILNGSALHGYVYGRWIKEYINLLINHIFPRLGPEGKKWLAGHYHGKVLTPDQAEAIITLDHDIPLRDLEQIIPYPMARDLVLKGPPEVAVFQCGCRQIRNNPCQPIQVCMVIGQPFVDFVLEHHPKSSRRLTQTEALELLRAEHERGHLHSAWFKDVLLDRFYAICNCCKCCCGGIEAMVKYGAPTMVSSGYVAKVDEKNCTVCGTCMDACPFGALSLNEVLAVSWEKCMGCGVCVGQCPSEAISLIRDEKKGIPLDVRMLV